MYTIKPSYLSITSITDEIKQRLLSILENKANAKEHLPFINEGLDDFFENLELSDIQDYKEYDLMLEMRTKIRNASAKIMDCVDNRKDDDVECNVELYNLYIENLILLHSTIALKKQNISGGIIADDKLKSVSDININIREKLKSLGFSYAHDTEKTDVSSSDFEFKLPTYFSQLPIGICIASGEDLIYQYANATYLSIIDNDSSIVGKKISDVLTDIDTQHVYEEILKVYQTGTPYLAESVLVKLNRYGSWHNAYFNLVCQPIREFNEKISGIVLICTEVTDLIVSRKELEESEYKFKTIIDKSPVAKAILRGPNFKIELANRKMLTFFWRRTFDQVENIPFLEVFPELKDQDFPKRLKEVFESGIPHTQNNAHAFVDGADGRQEFIIDYEYAPLLDQEGNVDGIMISAYDVTQRAKSEQALANSEKQFKDIASVMQQFIWTSDIKGNLNYWNQATYDYTGIEENTFETTGWLSIIHPEDREENIKLWENSIKNGTIFTCEHRFRRADGVYRWQLSRAVPQRDKDGKILQWVGTSTDIHDQIKFQETLEELVDVRTKDLSEINIELQSSNQDLESFAYISSHDLQEPLRKIQTFISIIMDSDFENMSERGKSYFLRVDSAAARMKRLITDLLTYSRTSAVEKDFEEVNLEELLHEIKGDFLDTIEDKGGSINVEPLPIISGISFQLSQLFVNLISNSIKFAKEGVPPIIDITNKVINGTELASESLYPNQNYVEITIKDNGIGFSQEYASKIFEVFQRLHAKGTYDGTGIGLAICKKIVDKHHGLIIAKSDPNEGATFVITLPLEQ